MKKSIKQLEEQIQEKQKEINELYSQQENLKKEKLILCGICKKKTQVSKIPRIKEMHYDNEVFNEHWYIGRNYMVCPKCKQASCLNDLEFSNRPVKGFTYIDMKYLNYFGKTFEAMNEFYITQRGQSLEYMIGKAVEWIEKK